VVWRVNEEITAELLLDFGVRTVKHLGLAVRGGINRLALSAAIRLARLKRSRTMQYLLLIHSDEKAMQAYTQEESGSVLACSGCLTLTVAVERRSIAVERSHPRRMTALFLFTVGLVPAIGNVAYGRIPVIPCLAGTVSKSQTTIDCSSIVGGFLLHSILANPARSIHSSKACLWLPYDADSGKRRQAACAETPEDFRANSLLLPAGVSARLKRLPNWGRTSPRAPLRFFENPEMTRNGGTADVERPREFADRRLPRREAPHDCAAGRIGES
jgi:hypothetical protein